jgi:hypothetical protein
MHAGKRIAAGDTIFLFASENEGGPGLVACGVVTSTEAIAKKPGLERQTPRLSIAVRRTAIAKRALGRSELKPFTSWKDGRPETELDFKFSRRAHEHDRRDLGRGGRVPPRLLLMVPRRPS